MPNQSSYCNCCCYRCCYVAKWRLQWLDCTRKNVNMKRRAVFCDTEPMYLKNTRNNTGHTANEHKRTQIISFVSMQYKWSERWQCCVRYAFQHPTKEMICSVMSYPRGTYGGSGVHDRSSIHSISIYYSHRLATDFRFCVRTAPWHGRVVIVAGQNVEWRELESRRRKIRNSNKKAVLSQGNRAMSQLLFLV